MGEYLRNLSDRLLGWTPPQTRLQNLDDAGRAEVTHRTDRLIAERQHASEEAAFGRLAVLEVVTTSEQMKQSGLDV